jgi:hypothetical protein
MFRLGFNSLADSLAALYQSPTGDDIAVLEGAAGKLLPQEILNA